jgi:hypothetical protein
MIDGYVDLIDRDQVMGWAADAEAPDAAVEIAVLLDGMEVARTLADRPRKDLRDIGNYGEGRHGFAVKFAEPLSVAQDHHVVVRATRGGEILRHGNVLLMPNREGEGRTGMLSPVFGPDAAAAVRNAEAGAPHYILHVGPHKTGSTYMQKGLYRLHDRLFRSGIVYPACWLDPGTRSHRPLRQRLAAGEDARLKAAFAGFNLPCYRTVILSSEDFADLPETALIYFKELIGDHRVTVVFYCRRWSELVQSAWQEVVKQGSTYTLPEFLARNLINPVGSSIINHDHALARLVRVFGLSSLRLVSYNNVLDSGNDILMHFLAAFADWNGPHEGIQTRENISLSLFDTEMVRILNALEIAQTGRAGYDTVCARYLDRKPQLDLAVIHTAMQQCMQNVEVNEGSAGLRIVHEALFERYGERMVAPRSGFNLFGLVARDIQFVQQDYLLVEGLTDAIRRVYEAIRAPA